MYWGAGPALGLLTLVGYFLFVIGAVLLWRSRADISIWIEDEISLFRRNFSRYTTIGPFYSLREESRLKAIPLSFVSSLKRIPRAQLYPGALLLLIGPLLFLLDFFI
jgi:hypothetical protein